MSVLLNFPASTQASRDRFLAFAFAAADLLVETEADGSIVFADGAFNARFRRPAAAFVGRKLHELVALEDHVALSLAMATARQQGRTAPQVLRLADREGSRMSFSALSMQGKTEHLFVTFGRPAPMVPAGPERAVRFADAAEARLRTGLQGGTRKAGQLGLVELQGWVEARHGLSAQAQQALESEVVAAMQRYAGPGATTGTMGAGRFGVLAAADADMRAVVAEVGEVLHRSAAGPRLQVRGTGIELSHEGLGVARASRALRLALGGFREKGLTQTLASGGGLAQFVAAADERIEALRELIVRRQFKLVFQPIVQLSTREVHHYEALLRPSAAAELPIRSPQEFVLFAEAAGLSEELDWAVLDQAATAAAAAKGASVAVNVSGLSMQSAAFRDRMLERLVQARRAGARMLIELTETADIEDYATAATSMAGLRAAGVPVCLDDFGAGSAAFRYLREFRVDYVKLDGGYVAGALTNAREHGFLLSMVELANFMGAKSVAETIETEAQARLMSEIGVEFGQGYLFGRPGALPGSL